MDAARDVKEPEGKLRIPRALVVGGNGKLNIVLDPF